MKIAVAGDLDWMRIVQRVPEGNAWAFPIDGFRLQTYSGFSFAGASAVIGGFSAACVVLGLWAFGAKINTVAAPATTRMMPA